MLEVAGIVVIGIECRWISASRVRRSVDAIEELLHVVGSELSKGAPPANASSSVTSRWMLRVVEVSVDGASGAFSPGWKARQQETSLVFGDRCNGGLLSRGRPEHVLSGRLARLRRSPPLVGAPAAAGRRTRRSGRPARGLCRRARSSTGQQRSRRVVPARSCRSWPIGCTRRGGARRQPGRLESIHHPSGASLCRGCYID